MSTATITNPAQLEAAYARTEQLLQEAAEAEHVAFVRWQEAYDEAATARSDWAQALAP